MRKTDPRLTAGFTLIEAMVALAITGLALAALLNLGSTGLSSVGAAAGYVEATRRAQSRLDAVGVLEPLVVGSSSGEDGDGFSWTTTITKVAAQRTMPKTPGGQLTLYRIEVTQSWGASLARRAVTLTTSRVRRGGAAADTHG